MAYENLYPTYANEHCQLLSGPGKYGFLRAIHSTLPQIAWDPRVKSLGLGARAPQFHFKQEPT